MQRHPATRDEDVWLVYDGQCPVCTIYCRYVRIRAAAGTLRLVDAREPSALLDEVTELGLDIDQGMILKLKNAIYYGSDAVRMLALLGTPSGLFNRINFYVFSTRPGARIVYPIGKALRNLVLKLLGVRAIGNLKQAGSARHIV
ncbi:MAG TPA: DCC1-like thiol-disulfide oxidoreductase family protein [Burkholderiaceae bacterium]